MKLRSQVLLDKYTSYKEFIESCKNKTYDDSVNLQNHHIIPKHLDGTDDESNLIMLSVDDHYTAHMMLSECFEDGSYEQKANIYSARIIKGLALKSKDEMDKIREAYKGEGNPFFGKKHTDKSKNQIAKKVSEQLKGLTYEDRYGEKADMERQKRREASKRSWEHMDEDKKKSRSESISKSLTGKLSGSKNPASFPILVDDIRFESVGEALKHFGYSYNRKLYNNHTVTKLNKND